MKSSEMLHSFDILTKCEVAKNSTVIVSLTKLCAALLLKRSDCNSCMPDCRLRYACLQYLVIPESGFE